MSSRGRGRSSKQQLAPKPQQPQPLARFEHLRPSRAIILPIVFALIVIAFTIVPSVGQNQVLVRSFLGTGVALIAWSLVLLAIAQRSGRTFTLEILLRNQHYLQACAHLSILTYWGLYWSQVPDSAVLIAGQLAFAYGF